MIPAIWYRELRLRQHHSLPHQLLVLWGLPGILTILFVVSLLIEKLRGAEQKSLYHLLTSIRLPDLFAVLMGLCAIGLVLIPELVYVRDIYENGNARANTMFKLTYQAYIMFGMTMIYVDFPSACYWQKQDSESAGIHRTVFLCVDLWIFWKQRTFLVW